MATDLSNQLLHKTVDSNDLTLVYIVGYPRIITVVPELETCPQCSAENLSGSRFCNSCGARLDSQGQFRRVENFPVRRRGNQGAALIGLGILFLFGAYLAYKHQACYQYQQIFGSTYCVSTWYPFRPIGLLIGLMGFVVVVCGLVVVGRGERS